MSTEFNRQKPSKLSTEPDPIVDDMVQLLFSEPVAQAPQLVTVRNRLVTSAENTPQGVKFAGFNPMYDEAHRLAREQLIPVLESTLAPRYVVVESTNIIYDPIEDDQDLLPIGVEWVQNELVVVDKKRNIIAGKVQFGSVGDLWISSIDQEFDLQEPKLLVALATLEPIYSTQLDREFSIGYLEFRTTEDDLLDVQKCTGRDSTPKIFISGEVHSSFDSSVPYMYFEYPNIISIKDASFTINMRSYKDGSAFLIEKVSDTVPEKTQSFKLPVNFNLDHKDLYSIEPISQAWMERLLCCEFSIFDEKCLLGSQERTYQPVLSREDVTELAQQMLGLPYYSRGRVILLVDWAERTFNIGVVTKDLIELAIQVEWEAWEALGRALGYNPRVWEEMDALSLNSYEEGAWTIRQGFEQGAKDRFQEVLVELYE